MKYNSDQDPEAPDIETFSQPTLTLALTQMRGLQKRLLGLLVASASCVPSAAACVTYVLRQESNRALGNWAPSS